MGGFGGNNGSQNVQNAVNQGTGSAYQNVGNSLNTNNQMFNNLQTNYTGANNANMINYSDIINGYQQFLGAGNPGGMGGYGGGGGTSVSNNPGLAPNPNFGTGLGNGNSPSINGGSGNPIQATGGPVNSGGGSGGGTGSSSGGLGSFNSNMSDDQVRALANQYIQTAGLPNTDNGQYWVNAFHQYGQNDPNYLMTKMLNGIQQNGGNMSAFGPPSSTTPGGYGPGTAGYSGPGVGPANSIGGYGGFAAGVTPSEGLYGQFMQNGGFSPQQISAMQQQGEAGAKAAYQNAQNDAATSTALTGGYAPNAGAVQANLARGQAQALASADVNTNSQIAQMVQQGQLAGAAGMGGQQLAGLSGLTGAQLGALGGMTSAYGAQPGLTSVLGNQMLGASGQGLQGDALWNQISQMLISGQLGQSQVPSNSQQMMGNLGSMMNLGSAGAGALGGGGKSGGSGSGGGSSPTGSSTGGYGTSPSTPGNPYGLPTDPNTGYPIGQTPGNSPGFDPNNPPGGVNESGPGGNPTQDPNTGNTSGGSSDAYIAEARRRQAVASQLGYN